MFSHFTRMAAGFLTYVTSTISELFFSGVSTDLWSWGSNTKGQLGDETVTRKSSPVQTVGSGQNWKQVSEGSFHSAVIKSDGTLWLWGENLYGQLGDNTTVDKSSPVQTVAGGNTWKYVGCGHRHTTAIKTDGTLWIWGDNTYGQLGDNTTTAKSSPIQTVAGGTDWASTGTQKSGTSVAIKTDGTLWSWGYGLNGQMGDNTATHKSSPVQTVAGGTDWAKAKASRHTMAIKTDGTLWSWGAGTNGELGDNANTNKSSPVQTVAGGTDWFNVMPSDFSSMATKTDGTLWTWGDNAQGQLGDNSLTDRWSPVQTVAGGTDWSVYDGRFAMGRYHSGAIKTDGTLWMWGINSDGQLGINSTVRQSSPIQTVMGGNKWSGISCGYGQTSAIYSQSGTAWSWGNGNSGLIGDGTTTHKSSPVQTIAGGNDWIDVSSGSTTAGGIKSDGTLWVWGNNSAGVLGQNSSLPSSTSSPIQTISGGNDWAQMAAGLNYFMAIKTDGTLWGWGENSLGQLGDGTSTDKSSPVQTVTGGTDWAYVSCGEYHTVALKKDGSLWLWGNNATGPLGDNTTTRTSSPIQTVAGGTDWAKVSAGGNMVAAIKTDGTLWTWGQNVYGNLGDNTTTNKSSPIQTVAGGTDWVFVDVRDQVGAIKTDGTLWVWGNNNFGQLMDNTIVNKSSPIQTIAGGTDWAYFASGFKFSGAIKTDGTFWTCGYNGIGALGDNSTTHKSSPVQTVAGGTDWKKVAAGTWNFVTIRE